MRTSRLFVVLPLLLGAPVSADQATFAVTPYPVIGTAPLTVEFTMCDINQQSAQDKKASIEFGDGQFSAESCKVSHTYLSPGTYQATLRFKNRSIVTSVQVMPDLKPLIELSATPNPIAVGEGFSSTITMKLTDPRAQAMTWAARLGCAASLFRGATHFDHGRPGGVWRHRHH